MRVLILRHAEAVDHASSDFARELTAKGREQSTRVGRFMREQALAPELILSSPYLRARQTAAGVARELALENALVEDATLGCGMTPEEGLALIRAHGERFQSLLLVGHQPDLGLLIEHLLGVENAQGGAVHVRKASLTGFWLHGLGRGAGTLEFMIPARLL